MKKEHHAVHTFEDVDQAMKENYYITGEKIIHYPPKPKLSDYYIPSPDQQTK